MLPRDGYFPLSIQHWQREMEVSKSGRVGQLQLRLASLFIHHSHSMSRLPVHPVTPRIGPITIRDTRCLIWRMRKLPYSARNLGT